MRYQLFLILENIRSLYNVGAIFRTAEAAGVSKIYLIGPVGIIMPEGPKDKRKQVLNPKLAKTALGAEKQVLWQHHWTIKPAIDDIKKQSLANINIFALEKNPSAKNYTKIKYKLPLALILGNEKTGIKKETLKLADNIIQIPMLGQNKSLNVAIACGIAMFEIVRQTKKKRLESSKTG